MPDTGRFKLKDVKTSTPSGDIKRTFRLDKMGEGTKETEIFEQEKRYRNKINDFIFGDLAKAAGFQMEKKDITQMRAFKLSDGTIKIVHSPKDYENEAYRIPIDESLYNHVKNSNRLRIDILGKQGENLGTFTGTRNKNGKLEFNFEGQNGVRLVDLQNNQQNGSKGFSLKTFCLDRAMMHRLRIVSRKNRETQL
jgi:hypothetical protein